MQNQYLLCGLCGVLGVSAVRVLGVPVRCVRWRVSVILIMCYIDGRKVDKDIKSR